MKYRHYKGGLYEVVGSATHKETGENLVLYRSLDSLNSWTVWARSRRAFNAHVITDDGWVRRFTPEEEEND